MFGRMTLLAALVALAACANVTPAGRNARAGGMEAPPEPPRVVATTPQPVRPAPLPVLPPPSSAPAASAPAPRPALVTPPAAVPMTQAPAPSAAPVAPPVAAPSVAAPAADRPPPRRSNDEDVVVQGPARQITPPGDQRTESERMQDINSWDRCVTHVQAAFESDPMRPQLQTPEEYCAQSLGMANRTSVPISRQARRPSR